MDIHGSITARYMIRKWSKNRMTCNPLTPNPSQMTARSLVTLALATLSCACSNSPPVHTYADVEAAVTRMQAEWQRSQLTDHPQQVLITQDRRYHLFFKLPLAERAIVVMDQFANFEFDGEAASTMGLMLLYRTQPTSNDAEPDPAYTASLFRIIDGYSEEQVRRFCFHHEARYARFRRNLQRWKKYCQLPAQRTASNPATDASGVCHPRFGFVGRFPGLAVADLYCVGVAARVL